MTTKDTSGPVYPCLERGGNGLDLTHPGMTLRQWYAGLAMQGMLACPVQPQSGPDMFARDAFAMADAMIAEGNKQ